MPIPNTPSVPQTIPDAGQPETPQSITINPEALQGLVTNALQTVIAGERTKSQALAREQAAQQQRAAQSNDLTQNPVFQTVAPVIGPAMQAVSLKADNALDAVTFYQGHPEAAKYRAEIEQMTQGEIERGRPTARESLWYLFRGNPANAKRLQEDYDAQVKQLQQITTNVGPGGVGRGDQSGPRLTPDMPVEAMRDALKGVSF